MNKFDTIIDKWQSQVTCPNTSRLFIRVLNLVGFVLIAWMLPIANQVWGSEHFVIIQQNFDGLGRFAMLLRDPFFRDHYLWFILPYLVVTFGAVLGYTNVGLRLVTWLLFVNIHYANFEVSNGGWHVLHHLFLLSVFLIPVARGLSSRLSALYRLLHNLGFYFIWIQISILYASAGIHKLLGHYWLSGEALLLTLSIEEFSTPWILAHIRGNTWYLMLGTWISLVYQLSFPILIWWKRIRPYLLTIGLIFHLAIAFIVGVTDFGLILVGVYSIFIPDSVAQKLLQPLDKFRFRRKMAGARIMSGTGD